MDSTLKLMVLSADERLARLDADSLEQQAHLVNATGLYFLSVKTINEPNSTLNAHSN